MSRARLRQAIAACTLPAIAVAVPMTSLAQEQAIEEVVVTGSFIRGTPQDAALPVDVVSQQDLVDQGSPSIVEMIRNLNISNGNLGETNQFNASGGQGNEGVATINLRGLGSARSLVLINGRRHVATPTIGVDISALPSIAIGRLEVLKDGAAALYGSDAIAGVANFITRENFRGLEFRANGQTFDETDGEYGLSAIGGIDFTDRVSGMLALEYERRSEVSLRDLDQFTPERSENPQGGYSTIGNPGRFIPLGVTASGAIGPIAGSTPDPECENFGNTLSTSSGICFFQFTPFDNLVEEQDTYKAFGEINFDLTENISWHTEALYHYADIGYATSPSYPPQSLTGPDRITPVTHPGLVDFQNKYPDVLPAGTLAVIPITRHAGAGGFGPDGGPRRGYRETNTYRLATGLDGTLFDGGLDFNIALSWSQRERENMTPDMRVERMAFALDGLGGPGCDPATGTPGVGDCLFHTFTSNGFATSTQNGYVNPNADPTLVAMNNALQPWLEDETGTNVTDELLVFDATFSGELPIELPGGTVGWAFGLQARNEKYELEPFEQNNLALNPCPFNNPESVTLGNTDTLDCTASVETSATGEFAFLAATAPVDTKRNVYGAFFELGLPITEKLNAQFAARFEDYGTGVGSTIDPKLALRYQATESVALRGTISTTFRGPPQPFLEGQGTSLQFVGPTSAFKAIDTVGNPGLGSEEAVASNIGIIFDKGNFFGSLDWWRFDFEGPLQVEDFNGIVNQYTALDCAPGGTGEGTADCTALANRITFQAGSAQQAADLSRVQITYTNGGDIVTSGFDWFAQYDFDTSVGQWAVGTQGTYTSEYDVGDFLSDDGVFLSAGGDFSGNLNDNRNTLTPLVDLQANAFLKYTRANHRATLTARYWGEYDDEGAIPALQNIDDMLTVDLNYNVSLLEDRATLNLSVFNMFDEEPPQTQTDLNYDAYTHSAFGRMLKVGLIYTL